MKKTIYWVFLVLGAVIGAGYASGREVWLFFGPNSGRAILLFAILFGISCYGIMKISFQKKTKDYQPILEVLVGKRLSRFYDGITIFYLALTTIIMIAGSGATLEVYQLPKWIGIVFIIVMLIWLFSFKLDHVLDINSIMVPVLIATLIIILIVFLGTEHTTAQVSLQKPSYLNAVIFTSVNLLPIISVIGAIGDKISSKKEVMLTSIISAFSLGLLSWVFNQSMTIIEAKIDRFEMPIYAILLRFPNWILIIMTFVIWMAIFSTALGAMIGLISRVQSRYQSSQFKTSLIIIVILTPLSFTGFQFLVELIYPIYGVINIYILLSLIIYPIKEYFKEKC